MEFSMKIKKRYIIIWVIYICIVLRITVFRSGFAGNELFSGRINLTLFLSYIPLVEGHFWRRIIYLFVGNIIWFVPNGIFMRWLYRLKWQRILVTGFLFSLSIEIMQYLFGTGISELDDLILNTSGCMLGMCMYDGFLAVKNTKRKRETAAKEMTDLD